MTPEDVADRHDNRAGYRLVAYGNVGLPVYRMTAIGLCLARKGLSPIEEFVLRGVAAGVQTIGEIADLLGLDSSVIEANLAELIRTECIRVAYGEPTSRRAIVLTGKGEDIAAHQDMIVPIEQTIVFCVDGLTRQPRFHPAEALYKPKELKDIGVPEVRAFPARAPELEELDIKDVAEVVKLDAGREDSPKQLLRINSVERRDRLFLEAVALVYRAETGGALQATFAIDGRLSVEHEQAFARSQGLEKTHLFRGLLERSGPPAMDSILGEALSQKVQDVARNQADADKLRRDGRTARARVSNLRLELAQAKAAGAAEPAKAAESEARLQISAVEGQLAQLKVRPLAVYEHAPMLRKALSDAESRVLIVSPWIRRAVVDHDFLKLLRQAVRRGVTVYIGYGLGEEDGAEKEWDKEARLDLEKMAKESPNFIFKRLGNTHAKVLIQDSAHFVITSFNWLSFKGNPHQTFREEWGTFVGVATIVDDYFTRMVARFRDEAQPPPMPVT